MDINHLRKDNFDSTYIHWLEEAISHWLEEPTYAEKHLSNCKQMVFEFIQEQVRTDEGHED